MKFVRLPQADRSTPLSSKLCRRCMTYPEAPEEPGLPDEFHLWQGLLSQTFRPPTYPGTGVCCHDLNLYYDPLNTGWYKRPDWFAVGVSRLYQGQDLRLSYVSWQEG